MANPRIPYRFSNEGPALASHAGGNILVHLVVNVEHWEFDAPMPRTIITPPHGKETVPDVPNFSWVDYGMRCGLPRIIEAITSRGLTASTSFNASVIGAYPRAAEAMHTAGWEFIGHGIHQKALNHAGAEAEVVTTSLDMIAAFTGTRPRGWLGPGLRESHTTPETLKAAGVDYVFDWVVDDLPNWLSTANGPLLSLPYNLELNDSIIYAIEKHSSEEMFTRVKSTAELFVREAQRRPRILTLGLHPHLIGVPHRFGSFERMLDLLMATPGTSFVQGHDIADWYTAQVPAAPDCAT
ncbi:MULTISPECIES: polysaccharide deacetylase family protein [unclassified Polaromonas]|uniref:polysaccharide deacetylase family protein n=1 Tax=unclassified Polaromonas TaxID=2638319 RepID=UPI0018C994AA|nr:MULTISPECIES: polysaccharide deacetylase family protein [unclassified Polaromonas]MBG6073685.1 peptidoglycan/xylan/chitin deacetylase (PgdA/CDA1 family) [Polaromonas sp. CG_9.7]MBG6115687.1 peptidoglycan/xylan/chitin deacetylase (PgdA/CDA1 family) [Polaromonas sp. CG_9.2]MDH6186631.1 peptidoglycan/xylan/chitin deacetylase (PgdA/CDA1 family) [Polaromonas sp. CG_23.6]